MKHQPTLDQIIDRHTNTPANPFRPFTAQDWQAFSGCESASPLIAEGDEIVVVIDGATVYVCNEDDHESETFKSQEQALAIATAVLAADSLENARTILHAAVLTACGFEISGDVFLKKVGHSHQVAVRSKGRDGLPSSWTDSVLVAKPIGDDPVFEWSAGCREGFEQGLREISEAIAEVEADA